MTPTVASAAYPTRYRVIVRDPHAHQLEVHCTVDDPTPAGQSFRLPTWTPGSYLIREFARHFVQVRAVSGTTPVAIAKTAKDCWLAAPCAGPLTVIAEIYAYDLSVRTAYLDALRGFFSGAAIFLCPDGRSGSPCRLELVAPEATLASGWQVATTLPRVDGPAGGFGSFAAADYDELIDHPVEMSEFARASFVAGGVTHDIVVSGRHRGDLGRLAGDLARICQWQVDLFHGAAGERPPFERYLFQIAVVGDGYGGLEHRSSTALICRRDQLPPSGAAPVGDGYRGLLGLASHEYFHSWNVKRIKPAAFVPYDLGREAYTRQLWVFEGFTSYYDDLALVRSGVIAAPDYLELLGRTITQVLRTPGRLRQSVADASFDAWIKYYRPDENSPNATVSYYAKGALVALALDLLLRAAGSSLDELMRRLWQRYGASGTGVPEGTVEALGNELGGAALGDFFARHVDGCEDPPLAALLRDVGVTLRLRAAAGPADRGGTAMKDADARPLAWLGIRLGGERSTKLAHVLRDGPAEQAGLAGGDEIVAVDGLRASAESLQRLATERREGERVDVLAFRRDELIRTQLTLGAAPQDTCWLEIDPAATQGAVARRRDWLGGT